MEGEAPVDGIQPPEAGMSAEVCMHPAGWSPKAAAVSASQKIEKDAVAAITIWIGADNQVRYSFSGTNAQMLWMLVTCQNWLMWANAK
jgi:hypothetical protein